MIATTNYLKISAEWRETIVSPKRLAGAGLWVRCEEENAFAHIPYGIVWDSGTRLVSVLYYPLKPHASLTIRSGGLLLYVRRVPRCSPLVW